MALIQIHTPQGIITREQTSKELEAEFDRRVADDPILKGLITTIEQFLPEQEGKVLTTLRANYLASVTSKT